MDRIQHQHLGMDRTQHQRPGTDRIQHQHLGDREEPVKRLSNGTADQGH